MSRTNDSERIDKLEKDIDILVKSVEKVVKMVQAQDEMIDSLQKKLIKTEDEFANLRTTIMIEKNNIDMANFNINAEEDLHNYMMDERTKDPYDHAMTKAEINTGLRKYVEKSGVTITETDE